MPKITFMGAGSVVFAKNILGDSMLTEALRDSEIALYDIDPGRLKQSVAMINALNRNINEGRAKIKGFAGVENRRVALKAADFVVNAIQVGGYGPLINLDLAIPKKFGLRQTIGDTLGIGGVFRALRTIPIMLDFAADIEKVAPNAWFLNYSNPMAMLTGAMLRGTNVKTVGLCHSVQDCAHWLLKALGMYQGPGEQDTLRQKVAGINHQAWLLEIKLNGKDIYPECRAMADKKLEQWFKEWEKAGKPKAGGTEAHKPIWARKKDRSPDMVRLECVRKFGYYITESSEHNAEYMPYWIKKAYPELIDKYNIALDESKRRAIWGIGYWHKQVKELCENKGLAHKRTGEFGSYIMEAVTTGKPCQIGGSVMNTGLIPNLPANAAVEVPCLVDTNGVQGAYVGPLPPQCAALNMTNINTQLLTIEAALTRKREHIYHAAMLDPHTSSELPLDDIVKLCDALIEAHGDLLPKYK
ncbi:MAG: alpha-glucosidase/alpha-galactosidase [Kiritimatiellaeota bacterium]|nr:alpha-glucosidase/alpha-galactosidase [Kiritimatiellota bacterium]